MPLRNLREDFVYNLLPPTVAELDWRKLIQAVIGGYQDRVADLRSYASKLEQLLDPEYVDTGVVLVTFTTDGGIETTISLDLQADTPTGGSDLLAWAALQLGVDESRVSQAVIGSDLLRVVSVDTLQLLAATIGATLYPGPAGEPAEQTAARRRQIVATAFPRLKFKGTARSWQDAAKLHGFDDASFVPQWSRFDGSTLRATADRQPGQPDYAASDFNDGPWVTWQSGSLHNDATSPSYFTSINGRNPLIQLRVSGSVIPPPVGTYTLVDGGPQRKAAVRLADGTVDSQLTAEAIGYGAGFNRTRVTITGNNDWRQLAVAGWSSLVKFRSSQFDAAVFRNASDVGTITTGPNASLRAGLQLPDGTNTAPWRPWAGGASPALSLSLWPSKVEVYGSVTTPRAPATALDTQVDAATLLGDARQAFSSLDDIRPATRLPARLGAGLATRDEAEFRNYPGRIDLGVGPGALSGTVVAGQWPDVDRSTILELAGVRVPTEVVGSISTFYGPVTGTFNNLTGVWAVTATQPGTVTALFVPSVVDYVPPSTVVAAQTVRLAVPAGTSYSQAGTYFTADDAPWMRYQPLTAGGVADSLSFGPSNGDPAAVPAPAAVLAPNQAGRPVPLSVRDFAGYGSPFRVEAAVELDSSINRPFKPALATRGGTLYPVQAAHGQVVLTSVANNVARRANQRLWWWLGEDATTKLEVKDLATGKSADVENANPESRVLDASRGWVLTGAGTCVSHPIDLADEYSFGGWVKPPATPGQLFRAGQVTLWAAGTDLRAQFETSLGQLVDTPSLQVQAGTWTYTAAGYSGSQVSLRVRRGVDSWSTAAVDVADPAYTWPRASLSLPAGASASDISVWDGAKTQAELESLIESTPWPVKAAWNTPVVESVRGDRYTLTATDAGQVLTGTVDADPLGPLVPAAVFRYNSSGSYVADSEYKLVGLGQPSGLGLGPLQLGLRGAFVPATGKHVLFGTNPALPAFSALWDGAGTSPVDRWSVSPPYTASGGTLTYSIGGTLLHTPEMNTVLDRIYLRGITPGTVYKAELDDYGAGPVFVVSEPRRLRPDETTKDIPTDHVTAHVDGSVGMFVENGQVVMSEAGLAGFLLRETPFGYILTESGDRIEVVDPTYGLFGNFEMYLRSRQRVTAPAAQDRWSNRPSTIAVGTVPFLSDAGVLVFTNVEYVPAGTVRLTVDLQNDGWLDDDFPGYEVEVELDGPGAAPITGQATWMSGAKGNSPVGQGVIEIVTGEALIGPWNMSIRWTNPRVLASRGRQRKLKVLSYEVREVRSVLCRVQLSPFAVTEVNTAVADVQPQAGAWVGRVAHDGTTVSMTHEVSVYSPNPDSDAYPRVSAADAITGSSFNRFSNLRLVNPALETVATPPALPTISAVGTYPALASYNIGDSVTLVGTATGDNLRYAWRLWQYGSNASFEPAIPAVFNHGGYSPWQLTVVDRIGQSASTYGTIYVNQPPNIVLATATPNNLAAPYYTALSAAITDPESEPVAVSWYNAGSLFATGTNVGGVLVTEPHQVEVYAVDTTGGTSVAALNILASPNEPPIVSIADYPDKVKANWSATLKFSAVAQDPQGRSLSALWSWWDSTTSPGFSTAMTQFGNGSLFTVERTADEDAGYKLFNVTITDSDGLSSTAGAGVNFVANTLPQIEFATASTSTVAVGQTLYLAARAVDPDGDVISYSWEISPVGLTVYGPNAALPTTGLIPGTTLAIRLKVDDGYGGISYFELDPVKVTAAGSYLNPITIDPASGPRTSGAAVTITSPDSGVSIRYTLDSSVPSTENDGLPYSAPFMLDFQGGATVTLKARAFKGTYAPSDVAGVTYSFTA